MLNLGILILKAFAEYFELKGLEYRCNTLLQFGDSWDLIGNAVLANPGSAKPKSKIVSDEQNLLNNFYQKYRKEDSFQPENWHSFSPDPTMGFIEKIFNGWYLGESISLNGVIQLFNTFNIKNQNLQQAITQIGVESDVLFSYQASNFFHDQPTYFGFSNAVLSDNTLRKVAVTIFENSSEKIQGLYNEDFTKNSFYHPMYINKSYRKPSFQSYKKEVLPLFVIKP